MSSRSTALGESSRLAPSLQCHTSFPATSFLGLLHADPHALLMALPLLRAIWQCRRCMLLPPERVRRAWAPAPSRTGVKRTPVRASHPPPQGACSREPTTFDGAPGVTKRVQPRVQELGVRPTRWAERATRFWRRLATAIPNYSGPDTCGRDGRRNGAWTRACAASGWHHARLRGLLGRPDKWSRASARRRGHRVKPLPNYSGSRHVWSQCPVFSGRF